MAGIIEILEEFNLELDDEIALISDFSDNLAVYISVIDGKHEVLLEESVILLDEVCFFEKRRWKRASLKIS